jgi:hypothetical protein
MNTEKTIGTPRTDVEWEKFVAGEIPPQGLRDAMTQLERELHVALMDTVQVHAVVCLHHNDARRSHISCPVCLSDDVRELCNQLSEVSVLLGISPSSHFQGIKETLHARKAERAAYLEAWRVDKARWMDEVLLRHEWQACAERLAEAIKTGNAHGYGLRIGDAAIAEFERLKGAPLTPALSPHPMKGEVEGAVKASP